MSKNTETCERTRSDEEIKKAMINSMFSFPNLTEVPNALLLLNQLFYKLSGSMLQLGEWLSSYLNEHETSDSESLEKHCIDRVSELAMLDLLSLEKCIDSILERAEDIEILDAFDLDIDESTPGKAYQYPIREGAIEIFAYEPYNLEIFKELADNQI